MLINAGGRGRSSCFQIIFSVNVVCLASSVGFSGFNGKGWLYKLFHMACIAQLGVSFLILYKDGIALLFHHFVG